VRRTLARVMTPDELNGSELRGSVAFAGQLACMTRAEIFEVVRQHGGTPSQAVTKRKSAHVGELGSPSLDDGRPSNKLSRATAYCISVVSKNRFLDWTGTVLPLRVQGCLTAGGAVPHSKEGLP
jgi:NAD-dependent DNA ligase